MSSSQSVSESYAARRWNDRQRRPELENCCACFVGRRGAVCLSASLRSRPGLIPAESWRPSSPEAAGALQTVAP